MHKSELLPHENFEQLKQDLWTLKGSLPHGNPLPRTMTVFRYPDGRLWVHSPIAIALELENQLDMMGDVAWIVVPNGMHRLDVGHYKLRWPGARVVCPEESRADVEKVAPVDAAAETEFNDGPVRAVAMSGVKRTELAYELTMSDGTALVVNDLLVNTGELPGFLGWLMKITGRTGVFRVPAPQKLIFLYSRKLYKDWLLRMAGKNFSVITLSHGKAVVNNTGDWLIRAANSLTI